MLTSLKLRIKTAHFNQSIFISACSLCFSVGLNAAEVNVEPLQVHGFVAQGIIDVDHSNFVNESENISLELTEVGINASYQLNDDFRLAGQAVYLNGGNRYAAGSRIDYLLLEWDAAHNENWQTSFYFGRVKNNHWLYSSARDIPFARPSIIISQVTYFDGLRDLAVGGDGAAVKVKYNNDELGEFDLNFSRGKSPISGKQVDIIAGKQAQGQLKHDLDAQLSIYWRPSFSAWQFGLSANDASFSYHSAQMDAYVNSDFTLQFYTANALYEGEFWQLSAEIIQERLVTQGFYFPGFHRDQIGQGYYLQARYQVDNDLSVQLRTERYYSNKDDKNGSKLAQVSGGLVPSYFAFHNDLMLGMSYDFTNNFRVNAEYHWVEGTARLSPIVQPDPIANNSKNWQVWAIQLMYWF
ncbi:MAG: hypothetical protein V7736_16440 [Colwellia polaris]|jgi:hypothetical protein|uniref:hypothetical protein n=1 Tax=Colwellia polaris TaxID=326537 RepID=UPI000A177842|nr:hypothetical protein [Colwellia polaris]|tara:strand:+ start:17 stop:1246 length:1230 start_codon:yes stop_codon:yes gene_type:complete